MTLLDAIRSTRRPAAGTPDTDADASTVTPPLVTKRQVAILALIGAVLLAGTTALIFGPGRGLRTDIVSVSDDLDASRDGIYLQLGIARTQLGLTEQSLRIQQSGLEVAAAAEKDASSAAQATQEILVQTREALTLVREVTRALEPLDKLDVKLDSVVRDVEQGVRLAQTTLTVAQQTLQTGREALSVARDTLSILKRSEQIQVELLKTARATLEEVRQINRKFPGAPVFPTTGSPSPAAP